MEKKYLVGIDRGASGVRAACFDLEGNCLGSSIASIPTHSPEPGQLICKMNELEDALIESIRNMLKDSGVNPGEIAGISTSIAGGRLTGIDENGDYPFDSIFVDADARGKSHVGTAFEKLAAGGITREEYQSITFTSPYESALILALRDTEPEKFATVKKWAFSEHPIIARALGAEDWVDVEGWAKQTGCYNAYAQEYDADICHIFDIKPEDWVPRACAGELCGTVSKESAAKTGLAVGTPIFVGNNDNTPHLLAQGAVSDEDIACTLGTYGVLLRFFNEPIYDGGNSAYPGSNGFKHGYKMTTLVMGMGASYNWLRNNICFGFEPEAKQQGMNIYEYMNVLAAKSSLGSNGVLFNPNVLGSMTNRKMKASFLGIGVTNTTNDLIRAVMEGVAYDFKIALQTMIKATKKEANSVRVAGGISNSDLWMQMFADVCDVTILKSACHPELTACMGAAMTAGIGAGVYSSFEDAITKAVKEPTPVKPIPENVELYKKYFDNYERCLKILNEQVYA